MADNRQARAAALKIDFEKKFGHQSAVTGYSGGITYRSNVVSTGSLVWDYMLGTGGWPYGAQVEVFGPETIGKTTIAGASVLRNVQAQGGLTAMVATEPDFDETWLERHGVNLDHHVTFFPDNGDEAFDILRDLVFEDSVNYILFDSLGGLSSSQANKSDVPQAYGDSNLITWGVKRVAMRARKHNIGIMYINQARDDTKSKFGGITSPGGRALKHMMRIRTQLKPGKDRYMTNVVGVSDGGGKGSQKIMAGRQLAAVMVKNKAAEGLGKTAKFDFYHVETDEYPFGFDVAKDVITAAKLTSVITGTGWLSHKIFPGGKINGQDKAQNFLLENDVAMQDLREEVLGIMYEEEARKAARVRAMKKAAAKPPTKTKLKAVENG